MQAEPGPVENVPPKVASVLWPTWPVGLRSGRLRSFVVVGGAPTMGKHFLGFWGDLGGPFLFGAFWWPPSFLGRLFRPDDFNWVIFGGFATFGIFRKFPDIF